MSSYVVFPSDRVRRGDPGGHGFPRDPVRPDGPRSEISGAQRVGCGHGTSRRPHSGPRQAQRRSPPGDPRTSSGRRNGTAEGPGRRCALLSRSVPRSVTFPRQQNGACAGMRTVKRRDFAIPTGHAIRKRSKASLQHSIVSNVKVDSLLLLSWIASYNVRKTLG